MKNILSCVKTFLQFFQVLNTFLEFMFITTYSVVSEIRGEMKYFPGIFSFLSQNWSIVQPVGYRRKSDRAISLSSCNPVPMPFFHYGGKGHGANGAINQSISQFIQESLQACHLTMFGFITEGQIYSLNSAFIRYFRMSSQHSIFLPSLSLFQACVITQSA